MGILNHTLSTRFVTRLSLLALVLLTVSCGPQVIEGRPPFINISGLSLNDDRLAAVFDISNQNGVPMTITRFEISVTVNDIDLTREERTQELLIDANSTEEIEVISDAEGAVSSMLTGLDRGDIKSLPFDLTGRVQTVEDGALRFELRGHLYRVPGKPGHYRAAVTQANELRRDGSI